MGLLFDKKLSFIPHIKALKAKCLIALDILKVLSNTNWGGDRSVLLNLYRSLGRSKLDYGSFIYGSARKSYLKCLDTIHHLGFGFETRSGNILSFLLPLFQEGQLSVTGESMCTKYWLTA